MLTDIFTDSDATIEQIEFVPKGKHPMSEDVDWFHCYARVTDEVIVGYRDSIDNTTGKDKPPTMYIIVCHIPSGLRFKVKFGGADINSSPDVIEKLSEVPRSLIEGGL